MPNDSENDESARQSARRAKLQMMQFYGDLTKRLKRHRPEIYIPHMSGLLKDPNRNLKQYRDLPPHWVLHSMEANCAYWKTGYDESVLSNTWPKIHNIYHARDQFWLCDIIKENSDRFFLMMAREQFPYQISASNSYLARVWRLFVNNSAMSSLTQPFEDRHNLTMTEWFQLCFLAGIAAVDTSPYFDANTLASWQRLQLAPARIDTFISLASVTPTEVKARFLRNKDTELPEFHFLIKSIFLEKPIIRFDDDKMTAPLSNLVFLNSGEGLYRLASELDGFDRRFGEAFRQYTQVVLECFTLRHTLLSDREIERVSPGKSCDFILEFPGYILLVECKATTFTANKLTDNAILLNNSTDMVAKGLIQLYTTAYDISCGVFDSFGIDKQKPVAGVVVTFGRIPLVNSEWYFNEFILKRRQNKFKAPIYPSGNMKRMPIVLSISDLERLVELLNASSESFLELHDRKETLPYGQTGDWNTFMRDERAKRSTPVELLPFIEKQLNDFYHSLGIAPEELTE